MPRAGPHGSTYRKIGKENEAILFRVPGGAESGKRVNAITLYIIKQENSISRKGVISDLERV